MLVGPLDSCLVISVSSELSSDGVEMSIRRPAYLLLAPAAFPIGVFPSCTRTLLLQIVIPPITGVPVPVSVGRQKLKDKRVRSHTDASLRSNATSQFPFRVHG